MICPRCKENVLDGSSYCVKCGYNFNMNNNQNNMVGNNQHPNNQMVNNNQMNNGGMFVNNGNVPNNGINNNVNNYNNSFNNNLNSNVNYGNNNSNNNGVFKEKKNGGKAVIALIVVALVGVVGFFGYKFFTEKNGGGFGNKDKNFFLINKKGEKISDNYSNLKLKGKYYVVTSNGKKGIIDTNGKLVVPCEYDEADVVYKFEIPIPELYNRNGVEFDHLIKKLDDNMEMYKGTASVKLGDVHMLVYDSDSGINSYYSYYTGKKFYEFSIYR